MFSFRQGLYINKYLHPTGWVSQPGPSETWTGNIVMLRATCNDFCLEQQCTGKTNPNFSIRTNSFEDTFLSYHKSSQIFPDT